MTLTRDIAIAAIRGLELQLADLRAFVEAGKTVSATAGSPLNANPVLAKRTISPAARKRMADAQQKRWAAAKAKAAGNVAATPAPTPIAKAPMKRKLSPGARKRIADATKLRWANFRAAKAAAKKTKTA